MIDKSTLSIATMTFARSTDEDALLRESLQILASCHLPVYITDGGSPPEFLDFLKQFPHFVVSDTTAKGLVPQVTKSLKNAVRGNSKYILYTEPDKKFFFRMLDDFLDKVYMKEDTGIFLASRSLAGFASYAAFQQMTESCINNSCAEITGCDLDFTYGPFLLQPSLVPFLDLVSEDFGWGWRTFMFGMASRLGLSLKEFRGEYLCPPEQKEDSHEERIYRVRQCEQSLRGVVFANSVGLEGR